MEKDFFRQSLGEDVSNLTFKSNIRSENSLRQDHISNEMVVNLNMFCPLTKYRILIICIVNLLSHYITIGLEELTFITHVRDWVEIISQAVCTISLHSTLE